MYMRARLWGPPPTIELFLKVVIKKIINYIYVIITIKIKCYNKIGVKIGEILLHFTQKKNIYAKFKASFIYIFTWHKS